MSNKEYKSIGDPMDCLAEECAEVIQAIMKIKRFGLGNHHPSRKQSNIEDLLEEIQDCEDRLTEVRNILGASRDSRILSAVPSEEIILTLMQKKFETGSSNVIAIMVIQSYKEGIADTLEHLKRGIAG